MSYGAITPVDAEVLDFVLQQFKDKKALKFLEIGVYEGATSRGIKSYCEQNGIILDYWGIDNGAICQGNPPFGSAHFIKGDSAEVFHLVPDDFDVIFVDGQHGGNQVILDTLLYGGKIKRGGFFVFHDTSPEIQQTMPERGREYPDIPWFKNSVIAAHNLMGFPTAKWQLWLDRYMSEATFGGMQVFIKL